MEESILNLDFKTLAKTFNSFINNICEPSIYKNLLKPGKNIKTRHLTPRCQFIRKIIIRDLFLYEKNDSACNFIEAKILYYLITSQSPIILPLLLVNAITMYVQPDIIGFGMLMSRMFMINGADLSGEHLVLVNEVNMVKIYMKLI